jgi:hypothetical protein
MTDYTFVYKCRLCGRKFNDRIVSGDVAPDQRLAQTIKGDVSLYFYAAPMRITHNCGNGSFGIANLCGISPETTEVAELAPMENLPLTTKQ